MAEVLAQRALLTTSAGRWSSSPFSSGRWNNAGFLALRRSPSPMADVSLRSSGFHGRRLLAGATPDEPSQDSLPPLPIEPYPTFKKLFKWWKKDLQPNMREIESADDLVNSLLNAGNQLVIVNFFSPGCAGCRTLHPKICQFAEMNPDVLFLRVNQEEHLAMCCTLGVNIFPFFRFYRGAHGRLCSFSCTVATIHKFKKALAKHSTDRSSLGPTRGLEEKELLALAADENVPFNYTIKPFDSPDHVAEPERDPAFPDLPASTSTQDSEKALPEEEGDKKTNTEVQSSMRFGQGKPAVYM